MALNMGDSDSGNRTGLLLGITWPLISIACVFLAGRFYCRLRYDRLWWDDWLALLAGILGLAMSISYTEYAALGGTEHVWSLTPEQHINASRVNWIAQPFSIGSLMAGKVSVGLLIARLQAPCRWRTRVLWISLSIMCAYDIVEIILFFTLCNPTWMVWDPQAAPDWGSCLNPAVLIINGQVVSSYMAFMDLLLAVLPIQMILTLKIPLGRKIGICILLGTGIIAFIFGVLKVLAIPQDASGADLLWNNVELLIWGLVEACVVIIAACVPTVVPLFESLVRKSPSASKLTTSGLSSQDSKTIAREGSYAHKGSIGESCTDVPWAGRCRSNWAAEPGHAIHPSQSYRGYDEELAMRGSEEWGVEHRDR